jgi:hypothetical protein
MQIGGFAKAPSAVRRTQAYRNREAGPKNQLFMIACASLFYIVSANSFRQTRHASDRIPGHISRSDESE